MGGIDQQPTNITPINHFLSGHDCQCESCILGFKYEMNGPERFSNSWILKSREEQTEGGGSPKTKRISINNQVILPGRWRARNVIPPRWISICLACDILAGIQAPTWGHVLKSDFLRKHKTVIILGYFSWVFTFISLRMYFFICFGFSLFPEFSLCTVSLCLYSVFIIVSGSRNKQDTLSTYSEGMWRSQSEHIQYIFFCSVWVFYDYLDLRTNVQFISRMHLPAWHTPWTKWLEIPHCISLPNSSQSSRLWQSDFANAKALIISAMHFSSQVSKHQSSRLPTQSVWLFKRRPKKASIKSSVPREKERESEKAG